MTNNQKLKRESYAQFDYLEFGYYLEIEIWSLEFTRAKGVKSMIIECA